MCVEIPKIQTKFIECWVQNSNKNIKQSFKFSNLCKVQIRDKKIAKIGRFFGEKSDFGGLGKDFAVEKSTEKISAKNRRFFAEKSKNSDIFQKKSDFSRKNPIFSEIWDKVYFRSLRGKKLKTGAKQSCRIKKKCTLGKNNSYLMH